MFSADAMITTVVAAGAQDSRGRSTAQGHAWGQRARADCRSRVQGAWAECWSNAKEQIHDANIEVGNYNGWIPVNTLERI